MYTEDKTCPCCDRKLQYHEEENLYFCFYCGWNESKGWIQL